jgi:hypothetical protein
MIGLFDLLLGSLKSLGPVYSATEAREEAADAVSQSRSVLLLGLRLRMGKASKDSTR